jgi:ATP-binding cassette subfamily B protein
MLLSVFCGFLLPQTVRFVVDGVIGGINSPVPVISWLADISGGALDAGRMRGNLAWAGVLVVGVAALGGVLTFAYHQCLAMSSEGLTRRLRERVYSHIQRLPYEWHVGIQTGDIVQRCTSDVEVVRGFVNTQLTEIVRVVALVVFAYSILFPMNFQMALASFVFLPVILFYSFVFLKSAAVRFLAADEAEGQLLSMAQENFTGVRVVRAFGRERYEVDRFDGQNRLYSNLWMRLGDVLSLYWGVGDLFTGLQMLALCAAGALQAAAGSVTVGEFIVFLTYNSMIIWPVRGLGRVLSEASKTSVSLGRLREILDTPPETDPEDALESPVRGDIEFEGVSFAYGDVPVLRDVSFRVREGTTLGILGSTGSGKTTVAHLICRLSDLAPGSGAIRIGGVDVRRFKREHLRRNIGIVLQEPFLYSRTIRENVASLSPRYALEKIKAAASISQVDDAIESFAHGDDTIVGERGVTRAGGPKPRVAIARAILREPPIMIFDDSLSAVDMETDARIRSALAGSRARAGSVTTLIISHRITSISGADEIMVMDDGRVVEMGSPQELLARGGVYRRIHDMQQGLADDDEEGSDVLR